MILRIFLGLPQPFLLRPAPLLQATDVLSQLYAAHEEGRPAAGLSVMVRDPVTVEGRDGSLVVKSARGLGELITFVPICGWLHLQSH